MPHWHTAQRAHAPSQYTYLSQSPMSLQASISATTIRQDRSSSLTRASTTTQQSQNVHHLNRRKSLRLSSQPLDIPIPPSLLQSPYLNSPQSIFQRAVSSPQKPSEEDEQWLQDTVPVMSEVPESGRRGSATFSRSPLSQGSADALRAEHNRTRSRSADTRPVSPSQAPPSPPLVPIRQSVGTPGIPSNWLGKARKPSESDVRYLADQGYFSTQ